jgi:hypothetical protein
MLPLVLRHGLKSPEFTSILLFIRKSCGFQETTGILERYLCAMILECIEKLWQGSEIRQRFDAVPSGIPIDWAENRIVTSLNDHP